MKRIYCRKRWNTIVEVMKMSLKERPARDPNDKRLHVENPIPANIYPVIDTDLGRDNVENDIPAADLEDLR